MNEHQLSKRLQAVAEYVPNGSRLADIGSDHAYLPVYLLIQGHICTAIAGEINDGPLQSAQSKVQHYGLESVLDVRKGDGLEVIEEGEVDTVCIAGMGGALISQILSEGEQKLQKVERLILQPNVASHFVREWLIQHKWELKREAMIEEDGKYYEVLMAEKGDPMSPYRELNEEQYQQALLMGPFLLQEKNAAFKKKWNGELDKRKKILSSLERATGEEADLKRMEIEAEMKRIEEGLST